MNRNDKVTIMKCDILDLTIAESKLGNRVVDIIDYKPNHYIKMNIDCMNRYGMDGDQRSKHFPLAISMIFKDNITLYNHSIALFNKMKSHDKFLLETEVMVWNQMKDYIEKCGLDYTEDGVGDLHVIDKTIQQYIVA